MLPFHMPNFRRRGYCAFCEEHRTFCRTRISHPLHLTLTVVTLGVWGVAYAARLIHWMLSERWRCTKCGHRFRADGTRSGEPGRPGRAGTPAEAGPTGTRGLLAEAR